MRKLIKMPIPQSFFVIYVNTARLWRLTWSDTIKLAQIPCSQIPLKTLATCATTHFQQRRSCLSTQNCTIKKRLSHQIVLFLVLYARKRLQRYPTWKGIRRITMDSQRGVMLFRVKAFENTHGYHISDRNMMTVMAVIRQQRMMEHLNSAHLK